MFLRATLIAGATAAMLALVGCAVPPTAINTAPTRTVTVTYTPQPPPGQPKTVFGDGLYQVGVDIAPGVYRSAGGKGCYWSRLKTLDTSSYIDSNLNDGPQTVQILPTDGAFNAKNCQPWQKTD